MYKVLALMMCLGMVGCVTDPSSPKVWTGTTQIKGISNLQQTMWLKPDKTRCGNIYFYESSWIASAFEDFSQEHYFTTRDEAVKWVTYWCKP